jgi:Ras GTPase-activating-like protein IQGAP2/3
MQRKNLGEVCKLLNQISVGRLFGDEQKYLRPLNDYIHACAVRFASWVRDEGEDHLVLSLWWLY